MNQNRNQNSNTPNRSNHSIYKYIIIFIAGLLIGIFFFPDFLGKLGLNFLGHTANESVNSEAEDSSDRTTTKNQADETKQAANTKQIHSTKKENNKTENTTLTAQANELTIEFGQAYNTPEDVAYYLHLFKELPPNYLTKKEASAKGWQADKGNLWEVTDEMSIGGDRFGNREGTLPEGKGIQYYEADVNYEGGHRGAERLVYSNEGTIYYSEDHYETFEQLYESWAE